jgi:hypothetical protein
VFSDAGRDSALVNNPDVVAGRDDTDDDDDDDDDVGEPFHGKLNASANIGDDNGDDESCAAFFWK